MNENRTKFMEKFRNRKNLINFKGDVSENKKNIGHIGGENFRKEIDDWISEDNTNVNFTVNDEKLNKTVEISGTHIL
ncbi:hypothetical protein PMALA_083090 [Plasmodium malariae]|uniref:Uncharacterized protein n=1 Tax=Plasmodium malariae TaxID=5858 RepID=A0A1A8XCZ7_PLAMA|nr:hypothetical protein PMALA_083090 [Plasmodium malariae]